MKTEPAANCVMASSPRRSRGLNANGGGGRGEGAVKEMRKMTKLNYHMLSLAVLKQRLRKLGLPDNGSKKALEARHRCAQLCVRGEE